MSNTWGPTSATPSPSSSQHAQVHETQPGFRASVSPAVTSGVASSPPCSGLSQCRKGDRPQTRAGQMMSRKVKVAPGDAQHASGGGHAGWLEGLGGRREGRESGWEPEGKNLREMDRESDAIARKESAIVTRDSRLDGREEDPGASPVLEDPAWAGGGARLTGPRPLTNPLALCESK